MRKIYDAGYEYTADGAVLGCHLTVWKAAGGIVAIARDLVGERATAGRSVALADAVWHAHGAPARFTWIEERAADESGRARYQLVEFTRRPDGRLGYLRRRSFARQALLQLLDLDYTQEWLAAWRSLPEQGMHLQCMGCGCNLDIAAMLEGLRYCPACVAQQDAQDAEGKPRLSPQELYRAREEFRRRAAAHGERLGLTPAQHNGLFRVLAGTRSLWEFRPEELRALTAQLEQFDSAAEVQEFLDVRLA